MKLQVWRGGDPLAHGPDDIRAERGEEKTWLFQAKASLIQLYTFTFSYALILFAFSLSDLYCAAALRGGFLTSGGIKETDLIWVDLAEAVATSPACPFKVFHFLPHHLWYLQLRKPLNMSLREPMWWRLSRMTTVGSSASVRSELHRSARLDRYRRRSCGRGSPTFDQ